MSMLLRLIFSFIYVYVYVYASATSAAFDGLTVLTTEGLVRGTLVDTNVRRFLGIPFAADTSSNNRFRPPQSPPLHPSSILHATAFGPSCPQNLSPSQVTFLNLLSVPIPPQSENCLSLNVWAPAVERKQRTAVLLWVYGGAFQVGSSDTPLYIGENLVKDNDDITVVSINYRLNIFASPAAPQLDGKPGNFGLLDIDAAIQWVFDNIAVFGGDPNRITLFGESAGASAIDAYSYSHIFDTRVKGIVTESGTAFIAATSGGNATNATDWEMMAKAVGCGATSDATQFTCMQNVPFEILAQTLVEEGLSFSPVPDGITLFSDFQNRSAAGEFLKVPLLTGTNANEADIFILLEQILLNTTIPNFFELSEEFTNAAFLCFAALQSANRVKAGVPTFRYRYEGVFPDISTSPFLRAFHSAEIGLVFGTYNTSSAGDAPPTPNQIKLSAYMQSVWVQFARDPAGGLLGSGFDWPLYNPSGGNTLAELGSTTNTSGVHFANTVQFDSVCSSMTST